MEKILIVEDDDQLRKLLREVLEDENYEVVEAPDGEIASRLFRDNPAELIITDLIMPKKEGLGLIIDIKKDFPETHIIAISGGGHGDPNDYLPIAARLGAVRSFAKPFKIEDLLQAVKEILA